MLTRSRHGGGGPIYALFSVTLVSLGSGLGARKEACHEQRCPQSLQSKFPIQRKFAFVLEWEAWAILFEANTMAIGDRQRRALRIYESFTMDRLGQLPSHEADRRMNWILAMTGGDTAAPQMLDCGRLASLSPSVCSLSFGGFILVIETLAEVPTRIEGGQWQEVPVPRPTRPRGNPRGRVPSSAPRQCLSCGTEGTSQWRESRHLCNACSLQRMRQERRRVRRSVEEDPLHQQVQ